MLMLCEQLCRIVRDERVDAECLGARKPLWIVDCPDDNRQITLHSLFDQFATDQQSLQQDFIRAAIYRRRNNCLRAPLFFVPSQSKQSTCTDGCIEFLYRSERVQIETDDGRSIVKRETLDQVTDRSNQIAFRGGYFALQFNVDEAVLIAAKFKRLLKRGHALMRVLVLRQPRVPAIEPTAD